MKAILYFVASGRVRDGHKEAATVIAAESGKKVVFRNGTVAEGTGERPEPNEGVAGVIPSQYAGFDRYDDKGKLTKAAPSLVETGDGEEVELNEIGLPVGSPDNIETLREALTDAGVEFHPRNKLEKLTDLYRSEVLGA